MNLPSLIDDAASVVPDLPPLPLDRPAWEAVSEGTVLGDSYRLTRRIAQGGMGDIYLASHERLPGVFVVKVLSSQLAHDPDAFIRFQREAIVMTAIRHPNVVQVVDFNSTPGGMPYLVMEYLQGRDLAEILTERRALEPAEISRIVRKVACGLDAAHRLGIVHRDLKPENIMVVPCAGQPDIIKLIDFGISKARRFGPVTSTSTVIGTPEFMSPEQAQGKQEDVDARSDQFALAVITYLLLTGQTPWGHTGPLQTLHRVVNDPPAPLATHLVGSFASVEAVLFRAMSKTPNGRYPSSLAFSRALDRALTMDGLIADVGAREPISTNVPPQVLFPATQDLPLGGPPANAAAPLPMAADPQQALGRAERGSDGSADSADLASRSAVATDPVGHAVDKSVRRSNRRSPRKRMRYAWEGGILFLSLVCGTSIGFLDVPTVRTHTMHGLGVVRALIASVQRSAATGVQNLSSAWHGGAALADTAGSNPVSRDATPAR